MSLRRQLLLVSLLLLALPWAGCQFVREIESGLRDSQARALMSTAEAVATALRDRPDLLYPDTDRIRELPADDGGLYAWPSREPIIVDGYAEGWDETRFRALRADSGLEMNYQAATRDGRLFLLFKITDSDIIFHNPGISREPNGDRVLLATWVQGRRQDYVISTAAPGAVRGQYASRLLPGTDANRIKGVWQDTNSGYTLELEMPLGMIGERFGFYAIDVNSRTGGVTTLGNITPLQTRAPPWLVHQPQMLAEWMAPFGKTGTQVVITDRGRWVLGESGEPSGTAPATDTFWLVRALYRWILPDEALAPLPEADTRGQLAGTELTLALEGYPKLVSYGDAESADRAVLSAAATIKADGVPVGSVLLREGSDQYLSLTDSAFGSLIGYSLGATAIAALGLLGYASILSWRISRLSRAAGDVVRSDGSISADFPRSHSNDEIGELSRRYADLLDQVREYNDYLRTLSRKLAHELRTPIAVIQSSLDNLSSEAISEEEAATYVTRARTGLERLARILTAMSEAAHLEESVRSARQSPLDLPPLLEELVGAYDDVYPAHRFELQAPSSAETTGNADLIVQALDKLTANAVSFAPEGSTITLSLRPHESGFRLSVTNTGPRLPESLQSKLFEPMVSIRESRGEDAIHLGLGLHVVKLVCDAMGGHAGAANLPDGIGVTVYMDLPAAR